MARYTQKGCSEVKFGDPKLRVLAEFTELQKKVREESQRKSIFLILQTTYLLNFKSIRNN